MAQHSFRTTLAFFNTGTRLVVGEVRNIDGPGHTTTVADASHLRVPFAQKRKLPGLKDGGDVTFTINLDGGNYANGDQAYRSVYGQWAARRIAVWEIVWPDAHRQSFFAFVSAIGPKTPEDDVVTADITLSLSGSDGHTSSARPAGADQAAAQPQPLGGTAGTDF